MLHDGRHKLIWYPAGNRVQLFDLESDPCELDDLAEMPTTRRPAPASSGARRGALRRRIEQGWVKDGKLTGFEVPPYAPRPDRSLTGQRGLHYPQPPQAAQDVSVGFPQ